MTKWVIAGAAAEGAMITLRVEPSLSSARAGFEAAVCNDDAPIKPHCSLGCGRPGCRSCHGASRQADPGEARIDRRAVPLGDCFAVGGEGHPHVTDAQWDAINALIDQAARAAGPCARRPCHTDVDLNALHLVAGSSAWSP